MASKEKWKVVGQDYNSSQRECRRVEDKNEDTKMTE